MKPGIVQDDSDEKQRKKDKNIIVVEDVKKWKNCFSRNFNILEEFIQYFVLSRH